MTGRALLIGCETDGLSGVGNDLDLMDKTLAARGFAVQRVTGAESTRDGILAAYRALIDRVRPDEPAVVYYSGHGGWVEAPPDAPGPSPMDLQFIAPADFHDSVPGDFRGITSVELSALLERLTARTLNATVILDCCHAAHLSRDGRLHVRALSQREQYEVLREHIEKLRRQRELPPGPLRALGNAEAVRIVACAPEQSAFEYEGMDGRQTGLLTESLALVLAEAGTGRVTWAAVLEKVRRRVLALCPFQLPGVEGPATRFVFETEEDDADGLIAINALDNGRAGIPWAALLNVHVGDVFEISVPDRADAAAIATVRIDLVEAFGAEGAITFASGCNSIPPGAKARRTVAAVPETPVLLPDPADPRAAALHRAIEATKDLRPADPDEPWTAAVRIAPDGGLSVHDRIGRLAGDYDAEAAGIAAVLRGLRALARVLALRALPDGSPWTLGADLTVEWGVVHEGVRKPLPTAGATTHVGECVYLSVKNNGADPVYISLIDIGVAAEIIVLSYDSLSGRRLQPGQEYVFGSDGLGALPGIPLVWPEPLDPTQARPETLLLLVSDAPQDVSILAQRGVGRGSTPPDADSPLAGRVFSAFTGRDLVLPRPGRRVVHYDAEALDFVLDPLPGEATGFLIEERPPAPAPASALAPRAGRTPSRSA